MVTEKSTFGGSQEWREEVGIDGNPGFKMEKQMIGGDMKMEKQIIDGGSVLIGGTDQIGGSDQIGTENGL